jgi:hypothetical protein
MCAAQGSDSQQAIVHESVVQHDAQATISEASEEEEEEEEDSVLLNNGERVHS